MIFFLVQEVVHKREVVTEWCFIKNNLLFLVVIMTTLWIISTSMIFMHLILKTTNGKNWNQQVSRQNVILKVDSIFDVNSYFKGIAPAPRSACQMAAIPNGKVIISGGYSRQRIKKDVDKGLAHTDSFLLVPDSEYST
jgi:hypothetical protein